MDRKQEGGQFSLLSELELAARFIELCHFGESVTVWSKGSSEKYLFKAKGYNKDQKLMEFILSDEKEASPLFNQKVLANSSLKSLQYFFSGKFTYDKVNRVYLLKIADNVYKFERRRNYRLMTYPNHQVKLQLDLPEEFLPPSNVIKLSSRGEQTKLFKSFLALINQTSHSDKPTYKVNFRVQDISISGLSFVVGEIEQKFISKNEQFLNSKLNFNEVDYQIPKIKVIYVMNYLDPTKPGTRLYKVGLQFDKLSDEVDNELSKQISREIRDSDMNKIFEDFLK